MKTLIKRYLISYLSIYFASQAKIGLTVSGGWNSYYYAAFLLFIILTIKPFVDAFLFPINLVTLNLSNWLFFILLIYLWSMLDPTVAFSSLDFAGLYTGPLILKSVQLPYWLSVILVAIIMILSIKFLTWLMK